MTVTMKEIENEMNDAIDRQFNSWDLESKSREQSITWQFKIPGTGAFTMTLVKNSDDGTPNSQRPGGEDYEGDDFQPEEADYN